MHSDDDAHYKRITPAQVTGCPPWGPWAGFVTSPWANLKKTGFFGSFPVWNFSENSSVLEGVGVPYSGFSVFYNLIIFLGFLLPTLSDIIVCHIAEEVIGR